MISFVPGQILVRVDNMDLRVQIRDREGYIVVTGDVQSVEMVSNGFVIYKCKNIQVRETVDPK